MTFRPCPYCGNAMASERVADKRFDLVCQNSKCNGYGHRIFVFNDIAIALKKIDESGMIHDLLAGKVRLKINGKELSEFQILEAVRLRYNVDPEDLGEIIREECDGDERKELL